MAQLHNELHRAGRIQEAFKLILGVEESDSGVERFSETLQPILDIWSRPEWAALRGERRLLAAGDQAGDGTNVPKIRLRVFGMRPHALIVVRLTLGVELADVVRVRRQDLSADLATNVDTTDEDGRFGLNATSEVSVSRGNEAAVGNTVWSARLSAATVYQPPLEIILVTGQALDVNSELNGLTQRLFASFQWSERRAFTGELE
ncbi:MAG: hypothetical protein ACREXU_02840 [Gammaproteobacteria bacterium]